MRIIRSPHLSLPCTVGCLVCGKAFELAAPAYHSSDEDDALLGSVCPTCADLDDAALREALRRHAETLREQASWLEELATQPLERLEGPSPYDMAQRRASRLVDAAAAPLWC
jgi:hypothetical protein